MTGFAPLGSKPIAADGTSTGSPAFDNGAFYDQAFYTPPVVRSLTLSASEAQDTASFALAARTNVTLAGNEAQDTASFDLAARTDASLAATEAPDTASFSLGSTLIIALAATEASDTAAFVLGQTQNASLAATESPDTASFTLAARTGLTLAGNEARDTASASIGVYNGVVADLHVSEAPDTASFSVKRTFTLVASNDTYGVAGQPITFRADRVFSLAAATYSVDGQIVYLKRPRFIIAQTGNYTVTGIAARLYESSFFYTDSEVIYAPQELDTVLVPPAVVDADENIVVPAEVQLVMLGFEDREIAVPADEPIEELAEYRESAAEARLRTA